MRAWCARLGLRGWKVYEGIANPRDLDRGPGHYPSTTVPGLGGTVAIAGRMPYAVFVYRVTGHAIVPATATWFERYTGRERLVLTSCTPRYTALRRRVVFARLVSARPVP